MLGKVTKILAVAFSIGLSVCTAHAQVLRIVGAATVVEPARDAADVLKKEQNLTLQITQEVNTTADKLQDLGENRADIAIIARLLTAEERAPYPDIDFREFQFGTEAAVVVVSRDVWDGGVHSLTREQARGIYEGKIKNWKELGGPELAISGFTPETGSGIWACYAQWLYGDAEVPDNHFATTKTDEEGKEDVESTPGSITQISFVFAQASKLRVLSIKNDEGKVVPPTAANVTDHSYPVSRPLILVTKGRPLGNAATFVKFMLSDPGQALVHKSNYLTLKELNITPPSF